MLLSDDDCREIMRLVDNGVTKSRLARIYHVSRQVIRWAYRRSGGIIRPKQAPPGPVVDNLFQAKNHGKQFEPKSAPTPTQARPGTIDKIRILQERAERGEELWAEGDENVLPNSDCAYPSGDHRVISFRVDLSELTLDEESEENI